LLPTKQNFVTIAVKWINFFWCRKDKALCKRPFALHCQQSKKLQAKCRRFPPGKISADDHRKGALGHSNESFPITAVRNTAELQQVEANQSVSQINYD